MNEIDWKKFGHALDVISDKMEEAAMDRDASQNRRLPLVGDFGGRGCLQGVCGCSHPHTRFTQGG